MLGIGWHTCRHQTALRFLTWETTQCWRPWPSWRKGLHQPCLRLHRACNMFARNRCYKHPPRDCRPGALCWPCHSRLAHCRHVNSSIERYCAYGADWTCGIFRDHSGCVPAWSCGLCRLRSESSSRSERRWACLPRHSGGYICAVKVDSVAFALSKSLGRAALHSEDHEQVPSSAFLGVSVHDASCHFPAQVQRRCCSPHLATHWRYLLGAHSVLCILRY